MRIFFGKVVGTTPPVTVGLKFPSRSQGCEHLAFRMDVGIGPKILFVMEKEHFV